MGIFIIGIDQNAIRLYGLSRTLTIVNSSGDGRGLQSASQVLSVPSARLRRAGHNYRPNGLAECRSHRVFSADMPTSRHRVAAARRAQSC